MTEGGNSSMLASGAARLVKACAFLMTVSCILWNLDLPTRLGVAILPPDVNRSGETFALEGDPARGALAPAAPGLPQLAVEGDEPLVAPPDLCGRHRVVHAGHQPLGADLEPPAAQQEAHARRQAPPARGSG